MLDQKIPAQPRVALVFGDADSVRHLREAVSSQVEIVYEASAADFDVSRVAGSQATAALVNLDDCESLDTVEARLQETGIAVVFNDPEISSNLEGWAQARWLRHLTAKLSGSSDFDPPRPAIAQAAPAVAETASTVEQFPQNETPVVDEAPRVVERPLSPAEIESMTADFGAMQEPVESSADVDATTAPISLRDDAGNTESLLAGAGSAMEARPVADVMDAVVASPMPDTPFEHGDTDALDVDTEALSAMIDARLAAAEGEPEPESPEVWRLIEAGTASAVDLTPLAEPTEAEPVIAGTAPVDDADVLKALPSLDDWQLVDPEVPAAAVSPKRDERELPALSIDLAGLELVPVETIVPVMLNSEPVERWMHDVGGDKGKAADHAQSSSAKSGGERA